MSSTRRLLRACLVGLVPVALCFSPACSGQTGGGTAQNEGGFGAFGSGASGGAGGVSHGGWADGGPAGSGGAGGASCTPDCKGRVCGPDGCGHVCGQCSTNEQCDAQGQCVTTCTSTWETDLGAIPMGAVADTSSVYLVGQKSNSAWAVAVDGCQGKVAVDKTLSVPNASSSLLRNVILQAGSLYAVGDVVTSGDPGNGLWMRLSPTTLSPQFIQPLYGTTASDQDWSVVSTPSGFWMGGTSNTEAGGFAWGIKGASSGQACGFRVGGTNPGAIHAMAVDGSTVYAIRDSKGSLYVDSYNDASCTNTGPCPCTAAATSAAISIGSTSNDARSALVVGGNLYVAGFGLDASSADAFGFVLKLDATGKLLATYRWNPTTLFDAFVSITTDGKALYVGGAQGWDNTQTSTASATAVIQSLPLGFTDNAAPTWIRSLGNYDVVWTVAAEPASAGDGLYVAGDRAGSGFVMRCQKSNVCPP